MQLFYPKTSSTIHALPNVVYTLSHDTRKQSCEKSRNFNISLQIACRDNRQTAVMLDYSSIFCRACFSTSHSLPDRLDANGITFCLILKDRLNNCHVALKQNIRFYLQNIQHGMRCRYNFEAWSLKKYDTKILRIAGMKEMDFEKSFLCSFFFHYSCGCDINGKFFLRLFRIALTDFLCIVFF